MKIDSTTSAADATSTATTGALTGSKDEFLKLFMAQLQHQDPLDPKSGADMVAQLAQFSSVEQAQQTNQHLIDLASAQAATSNASLANLVGRDCNAAADTFTLDKTGAVPALDVSSSTSLKGASAVITNGDGVEIRRIPIPDGTTSTKVSWDGRTAQGNTVPPGDYKISIETGDANAVVSQQWHGRVDAVELTDAGPRLRMGSLLLAPSSVRTIGSTSAPTTATAAAAVARLAQSIAPTTNFTKS